MAKILRFFSSGKLLITSEYAVIDGACALALPTKLGQSMTVIDNKELGIHWVAKDVDGNIWFEDHFHLNDFRSTSDLYVENKSHTVKNNTKSRSAFHGPNRPAASKILENRAQNQPKNQLKITSDFSSVFTSKNGPKIKPQWEEQK